MKIKQHKILPTGLHAIVDQKNRVHIYTELEYQQLTWWQKVKLKNGCMHSIFGYVEIKFYICRN